MADQKDDSTAREATAAGQPMISLPLPRTPDVPTGADKVDTIIEMLTAIVRHETDGADTPFTVGGRPLALEEVMNRDGVLPFLALAANLSWNRMTGAAAPLLIEREPDALFGVRLIGFGGMPLAAIVPVVSDVLYQCQHEKVFDLTQIVTTWIPHLEKALERAPDEMPEPSAFH